MTVTQAANDGDFEVPERPIGRSESDSMREIRGGQESKMPERLYAAATSGLIVDFGNVFDSIAEVNAKNGTAMDLLLPNYQLRNLSRINIIVGRNGTGKSNIMRHIASRRGEADFAAAFSILGFINPERGGELEPMQGIESNMKSDQDYIWRDRTAINQSSNFRQQTATRFRLLKDTINKDAFDNKKWAQNLDVVMAHINRLLENIEMDSGVSNFTFHSRQDGTVIPPNKISSGEAEIVSLAIEVLHFANVEFKGRPGNKLIVIDEPDVHLHPDLQAKFMNLLVSLIEEDASLHFLLTTHSISVVGAVATHADTRVCYLHSRQTDLQFDTVNEKKQRLLPILGSNLLSRTIIDSPLLIVEGVDDVAIWNQAVRTSSAVIRVSPCPCYSKTKMPDFEQEAAAIAKAIYDRPLVLSLQDGDGGNKTVETFEDGVVERCYLQCYAAENLVLTDEVFAKRNHTTWADAKTQITAWLAVEENKRKPSYRKLQEFAQADFPRKTFPMKTASYTIMDEILEICGITRYLWQELVGKCIGDIAAQTPENTDVAREGGIANFLGAEVINRLIRPRP